MTLLLGPADADHFRVKVGRYKERWYCDPLPSCDIAEATDAAWPSISTVKGAVPFAAADYVAMRRCADAMAGKTLDSDADDVYEDFKKVEKKARNIAFNRGTIIHLWFEDLLAGKPMRGFTELDLAAHKLSPIALQEAERYKDAIREWFDSYQPELVAAEVVCIHRTLNGVGYGGTADAIIRINGDLYLADWKSRSSDHDAYPEEAGQVAALAGAQYMIVQGPDGNPIRERIPATALGGGLIVSIRPDGCRTYPVTL